MPALSFEEHRKKRDAKYGIALQHSTRARYAKDYENLLKFCVEEISDFDPAAPMRADAIIAWAHHVGERRRNAGNLSCLVAGVKTHCVSVLGRKAWTQEECNDLHVALRQGIKTIGVRRSKVTPTGRDKLQELYDKGVVNKLTDPRGYLTFKQACVALGFATRPGELMGHKALRAGQCEFIEPCPQFPHGAAKATLTETKGLLLVGEREGTETAWAVGTGTPTCPVAALHDVMTTYGLNASFRTDEFIFAEMNADGTRVFSDPTHWRGAAFLKARDFNAQLKRLCAHAGIPHFTARSTRYGACVDMTTAGVSALMIMPAGRWRSLDAILPYVSLTQAGAANIARALLAGP